VKILIEAYLATESKGVLMIDLDAVKQRQQQLWAAGDFSMIATQATLVGELLCEAVDFRPAQRVLDVGTGSGNTALAAARRGADVVAIDFVPALLERGRERAAAERLTIAFQEGDAEKIPFPDTSFDAVLSTFGAMFAPNQEKTARELVRVCCPGGKIGITNWTPEGFAGQLFRTIAKFVSPPPGLKPPTLWGTEDGLRSLLGDHVNSLQIARRYHMFRHRSPESWQEYHRRFFGPTMKAFEALDPKNQEALEAEIIAIIRQRNRSGDGTMVVPGEYLEVVAIRK
jgi:ubiquinone/menaquinone biosynthesis C-methylase UbiE